METTASSKPVQRLHPTRLRVDGLALEYALDCSRLDAMTFGDLAQALALAAFAVDCFTVQYQRIASDVPAFETGAPHAGADPLDNQVAFELGDGSDDD